MDEKEVLDQRVDLIENEKQEIIAVYYLWDGVNIGLAALAAYREAARRGVKVKLMIDGLSVLNTQNLPEKVKKLLEAVMPSASVSRAIFNELKRNKVEVKVFNPFDFNKTNHYFSIDLLSREHEKISYFKSQNTTILGDRNWQAINFRMNPKNAGKSYKSVEIMVESERANQAVATHLNEMWSNSEMLRYAKTENVSRKEVDAVSKQMDKLLLSLKTSKHRAESTAKLIDVRSVRFVHDVIDKKREVKGMERDIIELIGRAREEITIVSPYFSWTKKVEAALDKAIHHHGVKIKIYVPRVSSTDAPASSAAFELQARRLAETPGYELYLHSGEDMLHGKVMRIDKHLSLISSHNMDLISEFLNYESGFVVDSREFARQTDIFIKEVHDESEPYKRQKLTAGQKFSGWLIKYLSENW